MIKPIQLASPPPTARSSGLLAGRHCSVLLAILLWLGAVVPMAYAAPVGVVVAWGGNDRGQTTVPIAAQSRGTRLAAGGSHSLVLKNDGTVVAWGDDFFGQTDVFVAQRQVTAISAGANHTVALGKDGTVMALGDDGYGQVSGAPGPPTKAIPVKLGGQTLGGVMAIAAGGKHTVVLRNDGTIVAWGNNYYGQTTVPAIAESGVVAVAAGEHHTVALRGDGAVVAWGQNHWGQTNVPVTAASGVAAIVAGAYHTVALKTDGTVVAWGTNQYGQTTVPVGLSRVTAIAAGSGHSVALKNDGTVVVWGANSYNQRAVPEGLNGVTAIAAGGLHTMALVGTPTITGTLTDGKLSLLWSVEASDYQLQSASNLTPPVLWTAETVVLQTNGGNLRIVLPMNGTRRFYRLIRP